MIIINHEGLLGDSISTIPAIIELAKQHPGDTYMIMKNQGVASLIPKKYGIKSLWDIPVNTNDHTIKVLSISDVFSVYGQHKVHPTVGVAVRAGLTQFRDERALQPEIEYGDFDDIPQYDYAFCAYSRANGSRMWPIDEWKALLPKLGGKIVHLGSGEDPKPFDGIDYFYDQPLDRVACLLNKARVVITIDNGIGRLAHAVGHPKHILLCSNVVGEVWGSYDGAHTIYDSPKAFGQDRVLNLIRSVECQTSQS